MVVGITGANGYLGGRVWEVLLAAGETPLALVRSPHLFQRGEARPFALGLPLDPGLLAGVDLLLHAAWDLRAHPARQRAINLEGALPLLAAAAKKGVPVIFVSTLSAYPHTPSRYGSLKLALEREVLARGGAVVRLGVVFGRAGQGLFGALRTVARRAPLLPLPAGGRQRLFLTHDLTVGSTVAWLARAKALPKEPLFCANPEPWTLRSLLLELAAGEGRRPPLLPLPRTLLYPPLRLLEGAGIPFPFRADSLRSLLAQPSSATLSSLLGPPLPFPPFQRSLWR